MRVTLQAKTASGCRRNSSSGDIAANSDEHGHRPPREFRRLLGKTVVVAELTR